MNRVVHSVLDQLLDRKTTIVGLAVVGLAIGALGVLAVSALMNPYTRGDVALYHKYSLSMLQGSVPYRDFLVEYPPLALLPMLVPQLLNIVFGHSEPSYVGLFFAQNLLLCIATGWLLVKLAAEQSRLYARRAAIAYTVLAIANSALLLQRYDIMPAFLTLLALWMIDRPSVSGACLGLGVLAKLYPIVLIPMFAAFYWAQRQYSALVRFTAGAAIAAAVVMLPFASIGIGNLFGFLEYHKLRGLQIESVLAGLLLLGHQLGWTPVEVVLNYGAFHLNSPLANSIAQLLPVAFLSVSGLVFLLSLRRLWQGKSLVVPIVAILLTFVVTNKVFSTQYLIWILPFAPLLRRSQVALFIAISVLSTLIYPHLYGRLLNLQGLAILVLNLRNLLTVGLLGWLLVELTDRVKPYADPEH